MNQALDDLRALRMDLCALMTATQQNVFLTDVLTDLRDQGRELAMAGPRDRRQV